MTCSNHSQHIIGIDPGLTCTGIALLKKNSISTIAMEYAYFVEKASMKSGSDSHRIFTLANSIYETCKIYITKYSITNLDIAIEYVYFRSNARSLILQSRLIQAIEDVFVFRTSLQPICDIDISIFEYNPNTVKATVFKGGCSKEKIRQALQTKIKITNSIKHGLQKLGKKSEAKHESIYDAMAVAYTHIIKR